MKGPVILQILPSLVTGGVERGTVDIARAVVAAGGVALVASEGGPMEHDLTRAGAKHITMPLASKNPFVMYANVRRLGRLILEQDVSIVHARSRAPGWSAWYAARRTHRPFITTFHAPYNFSSSLKRRYNSVMAKGDAVIAISHFIADHIRAHYDVPEANIRVIHRGVDMNVFDPRSVSSERMRNLARRMDLMDAMPLILLPGRLTRWKGQNVLIEALARLERKDIRACLVGLDQGRTEYRREIEQKIRSLGLETVVKIVDDCRDLPAAYMLSDVVVNTSTDPEGFGRTMAEAQAMGRPVIASNHGAAPEIVLAGETGWLVPPNDPATLAKALTLALSLDREARESVGQAAREHALAHFDRRIMCSKTLAVYNAVLMKAGMHGRLAA
jgi:glycosyltransferase involved in cell wall biosynthesis